MFTLISGDTATGGTIVKLQTLPVSCRKYFIYVALSSDLRCLLYDKQVLIKVFLF